MIEKIANPGPAARDARCEEKRGRVMNESFGAAFAWKSPSAGGSLANDFACAGEHDADRAM